MHGYDGVQSAHAAFGDEDTPHRRDHPLKRLAQGCADRDTAQQTMLAGEAGKDGLINGVLAMCDAANGGGKAWSVIHVEAVKLGHRTLLNNVIRIELGLYDNLRTGGRFQ